MKAKPVALAALAAAALVPLRRPEEVRAKLRLGVAGARCSTKPQPWAHHDTAAAGRDRQDHRVARSSVYNKPGYSPPSTGIAAPVMKRACSEQRKAATAPKSSGRPTNPAGIVVATSSRESP